MSHISSLIGQHFAYASGRTGVLQQILLTESDKDRLLGAQNLDATEQILTELTITNAIDQGLRKADDILFALGLWTRNEVEQMTPENKRPTFHILWIEEYSPLLSYLLKKHAGLTSPASREPQSRIPAHEALELKKLIEEDEAGQLPRALISFVREMKERKDVTPESIDAAVAQYIADRQIQLARKSGSKEILLYVSHKIDLNNIRTALRKAPSSAFLTGGTLHLEKAEGNTEAIAKAIDISDLPFTLGQAIRKNSDDPNALEMALSQVIAHDIAHMWNIPLSIEPVFAFAALAQSQLALLRALIIGKRANLDPQTIKKMLPPFLSASHYVLS